MLKVIGIGLNLRDISQKGRDAAKKSNLVYLESYTSLSDFSVKDLERDLGKKITVLDRKLVEETQPYLKEAETKDVSLLVYGDPLAATTHFEIIREAKQKNISTEVYHAPSIFSAVAETGLSLYRFGKVGSIPFKQEGFNPTSFLEILKDNASINAHTLFLLDLDPENNEFLTIKDAVDRLNENHAIDRKTCLIGCARLGTPTQIIKVGTASELMKFDFGKPPFCLVIPAKLNFKEEEYLNGTRL